MVVPRGRDDESSNDAVSRKNHHRSGDVAGDEIACTGKACKLCTAGMIADCVAVCCCPCAVVDILVLARRSEGIPRMGSVEDETLGMGSSVSVFGIREQGGKDNFSARFDSEEVWFDLYQVGHLGFGRVSFTEIPPQCKGN
nr:Transmembrane protein [Ipomoea batatas]GMC97325.1 Transmembrane protein [Ipomoea batatas]